MTSTSSQPLTGGEVPGRHSDDDGDPPQLPIIVPNSVQGSVDSEPLNGEIPAVVSITRVPAKPKQEEVPQTGGLKVRTDLGAPKPGPPPLLRVAGGQPARPALPPMPKLKLGGQRAAVPAAGMRFQPSVQQVSKSPMNGIMNMMRPSQKSSPMPIITNSMSLRQLRPKPPAPAAAAGPRFSSPAQALNRPPKQMATFRPQVPAASAPASRPLQVRTVFVPPPMKMKSPAATSPSPVPASSASNTPKVINSFNLNITPPGAIPIASGISITPLSKSNGLASPVIKGINVSPNNGAKVSEEEPEDDIELDDDDEGVEETEDKSQSADPSVDSSPIITNVTSLIEKKSDTTANQSGGAKIDFDNQKAKKTFKTADNSFSITISPKYQNLNNSQTPAPKRPLESSTTNSDAPKKLKTDSGSGVAVQPKPIALVPKQLPNLKPTSSLVVTSSQSLVTTKASQPAQPQQGGKILCYCASEPIKDAGLEGDLICQAVENIGGNRVGCKNKVTRLELVKLTAKEKSVLCDLHRQRLSSHGCCPLCGEFCSHGLVFMCRTSRDNTPHLFHRACYLMMSRDDRMCPHCGSRRPPIAVQLKMTMSRTPLRLLSYTAKMTSTKVKDPGEKWELDKARENMVHYTLPSGKVISAENLPKGLEPGKLEEILNSFNSKTTSKVTTRNMYIPTAAGDNVKLLQLLAIDYSPRQKFPEVDGGTPLHVAAANNHPLTAHILLQAGAEIDAFDDNNETPLMIAAYNVSVSVNSFMS